MKLVYLDFIGVHTVQITFLSYLGKVVDSSTKKTQSFQGFKNFRRSLVFILSYRDNLRKQK